MGRDYLAYRSELEAHANRKDNPHGVTKSQVGLGNVDNTSDANKPVSTAQAAAIADAKKAGTDAQANLTTHNTNTSAHNDIRVLISGLSAKLNAALDSDDTTLDQMSEIVAYIKANKSLIDSITTSKVNVTDIINNLTTNVSNKPLSAAQGVALKALIDALQTEVANKSEDGHKHSASDITSGTLAVARGGTGKSSWAANRIMYPSAATTLAQLAFPTTEGSFLRQGTSGAPYWSTPAQVLAAIGAAAANHTHTASDAGAAGYYGLNPVSDLNNFLSYGVARFTNATANIPDASYFAWIVENARDSGWMTQTATVANERGIVFKRTYADGTWTSWVQLFIADGSVAMSGPLQINSSTSTSTTKLIQYDDTVYLRNTIDSSNYSDILFGKNYQPMYTEMINGVFKNYKLFGDHNKPTGSYTGNGSATTRYIDIGVDCDAVIVRTSGENSAGYNETIAIITKSSGALCKNGTTVKGLSVSQVGIGDRRLELTTNDATLNANGVIYKYYVL